MQWFYAEGNQRVGPVSEAEFQTLVRNGIIKNETLVWRQGMANWLPYAETISSSAATPAGFPQEDSEVCAVSGKRYPKREMIEYQGQWISAEHRDLFFQRLREGVSSGNLVYAGFWIRFGAKIIDILILWVVGVLLNLLLGLGVSGRGHYSPSAPGMFFALMGLAFTLRLGLQLGYYWYFLGAHDATPGKMALGLKVVRPDGSHLSNGRIVGRFFAEWVSGLILAIGYIMVAFDEEKRALHDQMCDTRVIKTR